MGDKAKPVPGYEKCLVDLPQVIKYIYTNVDKKNRYIFSHLKKESVGSNFVNTPCLENTHKSMMLSTASNSVHYSNHKYPQTSLSTVKRSHEDYHNQSVPSVFFNAIPIGCHKDKKSRHSLDNPDKTKGISNSITIKSQPYLLTEKGNKKEGPKQNAACNTGEMKFEPSNEYSLSNQDSTLPPLSDIFTQ